MDVLKSKEAEDNDQNENPLVITTNDGEVRLQLEGSHTTSTETETVFNTNKKNVKFEDDKDNDEEELKKVVSKEKITEELNKKAIEEEKVEENKEKIKDEFAVLKSESSNELMFKSLSPELSQETIIDLTEEELAICDLINFEDTVTAKVLAKEQPDHKVPPNKSIKSEEISKHFEKIIEMFDSVTRNLENLELAAKPRTFAQVSTMVYSRKRPKSVSSLRYQPDQEEPQKHRSRYDEYYKDCENKPDRHDIKNAIEPELPSTVSASTSCAELIAKSLAEEKTVKELLNAEEKKATNARSISTATSSCELKSLGCQTQLSDHISFNDFSILEGSSLTSRSEQPNSLNNYAQAENACVSLYGSQQHITKQPMPEALLQQPLQETPAVIQEGSTEQQFSIITIEANTTPSATDLRRAPFCHRLWEVLGDFCAATLLCLQVNRDCIFCIGFFAAFVVSASFLTAFFYHTLIINPTLWQVEDEMIL